MPTFAAVQLDRYLETKTTTLKTSNDRNSSEKNVVEDSTTPRLERRNTTSHDDLKLTTSSRRFDIPPSHPQHRRRNSVSESNDARKPPRMSPALYATPEPTPLPDSPTSSFPPSSPFLINHKRRGPRLMKSFSDKNVAVAAAGEKDGEFTRTRSLSEENIPVEFKDEGQVLGGNELSVEIAAKNGEVMAENGEAKAVAGSGSERDGGEAEDFYDPQESMSYTSSADVEDNGAERPAKAGTPMGEFYDAWDELSSDGGRQGAQRTLSDIETELREMRLSLLMEIEKRKHVEEALNSLRSNWDLLRERLGVAGLTLPADLASLTDDSQSDVSPIESICRQVHFARFISESVGRGIAKAETEAEMEAQLETKNIEISRLYDRLHYYETMNREMSQRNQEAVEMARRERQKKMRIRQRWVWGSIAAAITLGSAVLAYSYLPSSKGTSSSKFPEASEPDNDIQ